MSYPATYVTLNEADAYMRYHVKKLVWDNSNADQKITALAQATRDIDSLALTGMQKEENQLLRFPRYGMTRIPEAVKKAAILIAVELLDGVDVQKEYENLSTTRKKYAGLERVRDARLVEGHILAGIASMEAFVLLLPYLRNGSTTRLVRQS